MPRVGVLVVFKKKKICGSITQLDYDRSSILVCFFAGSEVCLPNEFGWAVQSITISKMLYLQVNLRKVHIKGADGSDYIKFYVYLFFILFSYLFVIPF